MEKRKLGHSELLLSRIGFGAFKIGRNQNTKYDSAYELPEEDAAVLLMEGMLSLGINYVDTAPAYGCSEVRVGSALGNRKEVIISTKAGERFSQGVSNYDYSLTFLGESVEASKRALQRKKIDLVFTHCNADDIAIAQDVQVVSFLRRLKNSGVVGCVGFSAKTIAGAKAALAWADALMIEYNCVNREFELVIREAADLGVGVVIKKPLQSGHLDYQQALRFLFHESPVADKITSVVIGSNNYEHMARNAKCLYKLK